MALICVVDDEPALLAIIGAVLRLDGHEVEGFIDPLEAYEAMVAPGAAFSLLITDATMRPISGLQLAARIRAKHVESPVLVMTGHCVLTDIIKNSLGYRAIDKSFTATELRAAARTALVTAGREVEYVS
jgi:DNA-binding NtrC family response regulator